MTDEEKRKRAKQMAHVKADFESNGVHTFYMCEHLESGESGMNRMIRIGENRTVGLCRLCSDGVLSDYLNEVLEGFTLHMIKKVG